MRKIINLAYFVLRSLPGPMRVTSGVIVAPYIKKVFVMGKNVLTFSSKAVYYPLTRLSQYVFRTSFSGQPSLPPTSQGLTSFPIPGLQIEWFTSLPWSKIIVSIYATISILRLVYGFARGRKTTFTPNQNFTNAVRGIVEKPWDMILILFQLGSSTVIVAGILFVVLKYINDLKSKSFLPLNKKDGENNTSEVENKGDFLK